MMARGLFDAGTFYASNAYTGTHTACEFAYPLRQWIDWFPERFELLLKLIFLG
jgi:hypothetical protein